MSYKTLRMQAMPRPRTRRIDIARGSSAPLYSGRAAYYRSRTSLLASLLRIYQDDGTLTQPTAAYARSA